MSGDGRHHSAWTAVKETVGLACPWSQRQTSVYHVGADVLSAPKTSDSDDETGDEAGTPLPDASAAVVPDASPSRQYALGASARTVGA